MRVDPVKDGLMPDERVLRIQHPVVLVWEFQESALDTPDLQHVESRQALGDGQTVVQIVVDDQVWRRPVRGEARRIPLLPLLGDLPQSALHFDQREVQLLACPLRGHAEHTIVRHQGLELAAEIVALDPVDHVATVRGAQGHCAVKVDELERPAGVLESALQVNIRQATPLTLDGVLEFLSETRAARRVRSNDNVPLLGKHRRVPARAP